MPYFANFRLICELSTPLVNMRWFLYAAGHNKNSPAFFVNGIAMTVMFFAVRIAIIPVYWYKVYSVVDSQLWMQMRHFRYIMIVTCLILDVINIFWFKKMFKGAVAVIKNNWRYYKEKSSVMMAYHTNLEGTTNFTKNMLSSLSQPEETESNIKKEE